MGHPVLLPLYVDTIGLIDPTYIVFRRLKRRAPVQRGLIVFIHDDVRFSIMYPENSLCFQCVLSGIEMHYDRLFELAKIPFPNLLMGKSDAQ